MSDNQNRGTIDYAKYDAMATEELEEILRLDAETPEGQASDGEIILYVMGVLAQRKQNSDNPGKTAQQAWESFQKHYLPTEEDSLDNTEEAQKPVRKTSPWLSRMIAAAAVIVILVGVPLTAGAFSWENIWNAVAQWAKETFSFVSDGETVATEPSKTDGMQYTSLQQALEQTNCRSDLVPTWIPEGYKLEDITVDESPVRISYFAFYSDGEKNIKIGVQTYLDSDPEKVEINEDLREVYEVSGIEYYIFSNMHQMQVIWIKGSYQCYISGDLTIEEIKTMIDSIGKG